nr:MAG TPA: hypothetical protein [Caudoviricetes sp.]
MSTSNRVRVKNDKNGKCRVWAKACMGHYFYTLFEVYGTEEENEK